jgi:hypothetical protein
MSPSKSESFEFYKFENLKSLNKKTKTFHAGKCFFFPEINESPHRNKIIITKKAQYL